MASERVFVAYNLPLLWSSSVNGVYLYSSLVLLGLHAPFFCVCLVKEQEIQLYALSDYSRRDLPNSLFPEHTRFQERYSPFWRRFVMRVFCKQIVHHTMFMFTDKAQTALFKDPVRAAL